MTEHFSLENYKETCNPLTGELLSIDFPIGIWIEWSPDGTEILSLWRDWPVCSTNRWGSDLLTRSISRLWSAMKENKELVDLGAVEAVEDFEWYRHGYGLLARKWHDATLEAVINKIAEGKALWPDKTLDVIG
jgi:hypothetical protein